MEFKKVFLMLIVSLGNEITVKLQFKC